MSVDSIKPQIREFLGKFFQTTTLQDSDDIFALGFVNSLFAMQLVMFVEKTFQITVEDDDLNIDHFRSINAMNDFVLRKQHKNDHAPHTTAS